MPIYQHACFSEVCPEFGKPFENYFHHYTEETPACPSCGGGTKRLISGFSSPLMGDIGAKYVDRSINGAEKLSDGGHWAWRTRNTLSGKPEAVRIETFQQQREFCKQEGLANPSEVPRNFGPGEGGKGEANTCGMPGTWV